MVNHGDENPGRGNWSGKLDFLLSTIGYCVGLGNIWRFPYRAYESGGAVFLIPYVVCLFAAGLPLYFMELSFGQFGSSGPISIWKAVPVFKGIGYAMVVISGLVCIYYNLIIAYTLYYLFASFTLELPWQHCRDEWQDEFNCVEPVENFTQHEVARKLFCSDMKLSNMTSDPSYVGNCTRPPITPSAIFWQREVLNISGGIDEGYGDFKWDLCLCLLLAWVIVFMCLIRGIKSSGKVVYVTATFPFIVLIILCVRNATLPGARTGIEFYIVPESIDPLLDSSVWYSAAVQIFYSLGIAFGGLETMASYNKFKNNIFRDAIFVALVNCCTSVFAGFVIFSVLGYMAERTGLEVKEVAQYGPGLIFVAYPEGLATMAIAPLWSILFFLMILTVGLDSQFTMMETVITAIVDEFRLTRWRHGKLCVTATACISFFLIGLPQCSRAGIYIMNLFDWYSAGFSLFIVSFFEIIAIAWVYGFKRFSEDIALMVGNPCCGCFRVSLYIYWWPMWILITPAMILFLVIYAGITNVPISYAGVDYPDWADAIGWAMVGAALIFIPLLALVEYCKAHDFYKASTMHKLYRPQPDWGPVLDIHREGSRYERQEVITMTSVSNQGYSHQNNPYAREGLPVNGFDYVTNESSMTKKEKGPPAYDARNAEERYNVDQLA
ncbi:hypothetical protein CAPTEDRAFT_166146 [Capitella teleta]|uniref:Transporter n=1 Tax=Capitella teleta TaxID=283909 RepID=R7V068_CAPTE|nr:hypothetical protein CAPTEDRAFT_166146 [Capitella teleta]|eukprot:ELU09587.1 hypothetical protein CAPTEDRAFT_166146 [Capitella teleta]